MKRVLMVAYHFPPLAGSSGIQRTLRFVQQLPEFGWEPVVLTTTIRAYERTSTDLDTEVPGDIVVERAFALDARRQLSIAGRYPAWLARPDRWMTWRFAGVRAGLALIRRLRPEAIWSTYPIATAHAIGASIARRSGLPWIADFRDPMAQEGYPLDPKVWRSFKRVEEATIHAARFSVFTTPGAARMYRERYPERAATAEVIENGYDEESFTGLDAEALAREPLNPGAVTFLHSGVVYPSERDPTQLFAALAQLIRSRADGSMPLKLRFRAPAHDALLTDLARRFEVTESIEVLPPIPYREALAEMLRADALLILQASNCNDQIPAKLYEYFRCGRPIVALTDPGGDTAATLRGAGLDAIAPLDSASDIAEILTSTLIAIRGGNTHIPDHAAVTGASRRGRTQALAALLDRASAKYPNPARA